MIRNHFSSFSYPDVPGLRKVTIGISFRVYLIHQTHYVIRTFIKFASNNAAFEAVTNG
jgi:hypothetical protein